MADIVNPEAIKFVNEIIRPLAEARRALDARIEDALNKWNSTVSPGVTFGAQFADNLDGLVQDGRDADGISRLTGNDVVNFVTRLVAVKTDSDLVGARTIIAKPCVRAFEVV